MPVLYNFTGSNMSTILVTEENIGLTYPFGLTGAPFGSTTTTLERIRSNIRVLLRTNIGERPMQPEFGIRIKEFLFEQIEEEDEQVIKDNIAVSIGRWIPEVILENVEVIQDVANSELSRLSVKIKFSLANNIDITAEEIVVLQA